MKRIHLLIAQILLAIVAVPTMVTSCSDEPAAANYYTFTGEMASDYMDNRPETFSEFTKVLKRSGLYGMMAAYGTYTVLAPTNDAISLFLTERGKENVDQLTKAECDTLSWNHIVRKAYFTHDLIDGNIPTANLNGRYLTFSCEGDATTGQVSYLINKLSKMVVRDDSVENGVVHTLDHVIVPNTEFLGEVMTLDPTISLFTRALTETHLNDSLTKWIDDTYSIGVDSIDKIFTVSRGEGDNHRVSFMDKREYKFTCFVEQDMTYNEKGINTFEDLVAYAKQIYDEVYPEDAGLYDNDFTHRKNPLNRFVSYHIIPYYGAYNDLTVTGDRKGCQRSDLLDMTDWYTSFMPGAILKVSAPAEGLFLNRKGVGPKYTVRGSKVLSPSEMGKVDQQAINGIFHYIDDILTYNRTTRDVVFNDRMRFNIVTMSPEFLNAGARGLKEDSPMGSRVFTRVEGWTFKGEYPKYIHLRETAPWMNTYADCVDVYGQLDITFKLPPIPQNTYEIRYACGWGSNRGVIQVYFGTSLDDLQPVGTPIDLTIHGGDPRIGYVDDVEGDEETNIALDKAMHNRGYMKDMDSWTVGEGGNPLRTLAHKYRKVLVTTTMDPSKEYYLRIKSVTENKESYTPINYLEFCPKSVYAGVDAEDMH